MSFRKRNEKFRKLELGNILKIWKSGKEVDSELNEERRPSEKPIANRGKAVRESTVK